MFVETPFDGSEPPRPDGAAAAPEALGELVRGGGGAFSENTERALRSDLAIFAAWCAASGRRALPAGPETVAAFVDAMAEARAPATVRRYVTSISIAHRIAGCADAAKSESVRLALKRMDRSKGRRQAQATGLTWPLRNRLLDAAGERLIDDRNRALLAVAYDTLLRRSELSALQVPDLFEEIDGDATVLVRRSKTDQEGEGETVWVAPDSVAFVRTWLSRSGIAGGFLFRSVAKGGRAGGRCRPARCRASSRRWRGRPDFRSTWSTACRGTARGSARPRT